MKPVFQLITASLLMCAASLPLRAQWYLQYPNENPTGFTYNDCYFTDTLSGWIVGAAGAILHTENGGQTWVHQNSLGACSLNSITFTDELNGWAVGGTDDNAGNTSYVILHTPDGGSNWQILEYGTGSVLKDVSFPDALHGWAVGSNGLILHTSDGGTTWNTQVTGHDLLNNISCVQFVNELEGWISARCSGIDNDKLLLRTTDGGNTWSILYEYSEYEYYDEGQHFYFINTNTGWITDERKVLKTSDGGETFSQIAEVGMGSIEKVYFTDENHGWIAGTVCFQPGPAAMAIYRTTDGGATWIGCPLPSLPLSSEAADFFFTDTSNGWLIGNSGEGVLFKTSDSGMHWTRTPLFIHFYSLSFTDSVSGWGISGQGIYQTADGGQNWVLREDIEWQGDNWPRDIDFSDQNHGWLILSGGTIQKTNNKGSTWQVQYDRPRESLLRVFSIDSLNAWITGYVEMYSNGADTSFILHTANGGQTWQRQIYLMGISYLPPFFDVFFSDVMNGWTVGGSGNIYKTINGGLTWEQLNSGTDEDLTSVFFCNTTIGWACADNGAILHTDDGGTTWQLQQTNTNTYLNKISFSDTLTGWAIGSSGIILYTSDGGTTWEQLESCTSKSLHDLVFLTQNHALIGGQEVLLESTDGGITWTKQIGENDYFPLAAVWFTDENTGWAVGGTILKTTDSGENWEMVNTQFVDSFVDVEFANEQTGWMLGNSNVLKTSDGGTNWATLFSPSSASFRQMCFTDVSHGWIAGLTNGIGKIYHTVDGGNNWIEQYSDLVERINTIFFINDQEGWAAGKILLHTLNGGATWYIQDSVNSGTIHDIYFVDEHNGWAVWDSYIKRTSDGGATWIQSGYYPDPKKIFFIDRYHGWFTTSHSQLYTTLDGGQTWETDLDLSGYDSQNTFNMFFLPNGEGWLVGNNSLILHNPDALYTSYDEPETTESLNESSLHVFPNPADRIVNLQYDLKAEASVKIDICNVHNQHVLILIDGSMTAGRHVHTLNTSGLPAGIYVVRMLVDNRLETVKFIKL